MPSPWGSSSVIEESMRVDPWVPRPAAGARRVSGIALCVALLAVRAGAVVIDSGDGGGNASAQPDTRRAGA
jgi:hypothetical protein